MRISFAKAAIVAAAVVMAAGGAGAAIAETGGVHPNVVVDTNYQENMAGYQVFGNGLQDYNEIRGTVTLPSSENLVVDPDTVAIGMIMQQDVDGGVTAALGFVYDAGGSSKCASDQWTLMANTGTPSTPGPIPLSALDLLTNESAVPASSPSDICLNDGQSYYLEIHYSTHLHEVAYVAGPSEFGDNSDIGSDNISAGTGFQNPAIGTFINAPGLTDLTDGSVQGSWTRDGLTQPAGFNSKFGAAGARIPFSYPSTQLVESTEDGGVPTVSNLLTLVPSAFGAGASFSVTVP
jgi:hypothetical protein